MNTAPKLSPRDKLKELLSSAYHHGRNSFHFNTGDQADKFLAAIAPPSGEGVDARELLAMEYERDGCTAYAGGLREGPVIDKDSARAIRAINAALSRVATTPQSAPVDGLRRALYWIMRQAESSKEVCGDDPESITAIRNARFASLASAAATALGIIRGPEYPVVPDATHPTLQNLLYFTEHCLSAADEGVDYAVPREWLDAMTTMGIMEKVGRGRWTPTDQAESFVAALTTPPPASQERGVRCDAIPKHDWEILSVEANEYAPDLEGGWKRCKVCGTRCHFTRDASPPSSAAEASINSPEIDSKLIPDAAEQAKPDPCIECGADPGEPCYPNCCTRVAEQAQAGEVCPFCGREGKHLGNEACQGLNNPTTFTLTNELPDLPEHAGTMEWTRQSGRLDIPELGYTADQMREYANACRLAGGVTVDDEVKEYLEGAYRHIANVSGSALLAGEKHGKEDKHLLYKEACLALCFVGNAYYRLTGNNPPLEAK